jgi:CMP-N-acetylneuraminic acid synthetase
MILDDHEIYHDSGFHYIDNINRNNFDFFLSEQARICYYRYQKQLWVDIDFTQDFNKMELVYPFKIFLDVLQHGIKFPLL